MLEKSPLNNDGPPDDVGGTLRPSEPRIMSSSVKPMSARKLVADKLLWETLERWKRSSPELDRIQFLKTVPFFNELSHRQLKTVSDTVFERHYEPDGKPHPTAKVLSHARRRGGVAARGAG
jgi:hypothetical protein